MEEIGKNGMKPRMSNNKAYMKQSMNIVCATDDNYVPLCGIMLTSLLENNKDRHIDVYILTKELNKKSKNLFDRLLRAREYNAEIHICEITDQSFENCPIRFGDHVSIVTYYRFLIPQILPATTDKALYLDCDMVITDSLYSLYDMDMSGISLAACPEHDGKKEFSPGAQQHIERLGYPKEWGYFNAGVLMINLIYWREHKVSDMLFEYINKYQEKCLLHDQDTLNAVLGNQKKALPHKYNFMTFCFIHKFKRYDKSVFLKERPIIIHYCTPAKPWDWYLPDYPFKKHWEHYRNISPWKHWRGNLPFKERFRRQILTWLHILRGKEFNVYEDSWKKWK